MKNLVQYDHEVGADGAKVQAAVGVDGDQLAIQMKATYPLSKIVDPVASWAEGMIDKLEAFIPGDQKAEAAALKASVRAELVKLLSEQPAPQAEPVQG